VSLGRYSQPAPHPAQEQISARVLIPPGRVLQAVARPSEVDDRHEMMASAESSTCRSEAIVTGGGQVAIVEHRIYDI
jgi:hypothetical protein